MWRALLIALLSIETARAEYLEGTARFRSKEWSEALRLFEHSRALEPSPNAELMIARCLVELGRPVDAAGAYARAAVEARRRVLAGEAKYEPTAEAATTEGNALRARLGTLRVHVTPSNGATLVVGGSPVALTPEGEATIVREPGVVALVARDAGGIEQRREVSVRASASHPVDFVFFAEKSPPVWPALASAGVMVGGLGVFIGFGASSQATYDSIQERCAATKCGPADRSEAEDGERAQTIANVGLAVAGVAALATIVFAVGALGSHRSSDRMVTP